MTAPSQLARVCKASTSSLRCGSRLLVSRRGFQSLTQASTKRSTVGFPASVSTLATKTRLLQWRSFACSSRCLAEEVKGGMPFESNVMNLLANNEEFRKLVGEFAERMKEILGIDVNAGQMPSMSDMMRCAQDPQLRDLSVKLTKILQDDGINLSPETLKLLWSGMQGKGQS